MPWILRTAVMLALGSTSALAQNDPAAPGWVPTLVIRGVQSLPESAQVIGDRRLAKGEPLAVTIWTGSSLCSIGIGESVQQQTVPTNVWKMTGDYLGVRDGRHQVRVTTGFTRLSGSASGAATTQTLSLREGDSVVLDALSEPVGAACPVHVVTFEAKLVMQAADPELARARYAADLWLVHRDPEGRERREHLVTNVSANGSAMPFVFSGIPFQIPLVDPRQGNVQAVIQVTGSLRARPRPNGDVEVEVETNPFVFGLFDPEKPGKPGSEPRRMSFATQPEETIAVDFPPPSSGYSSLALTNSTRTVRVEAKTLKIVVPQPTDAVQVKNDRLILYPSQFFKGHKTQLLITLHKLE